MPALSWGGTSLKNSQIKLCGSTNPATNGHCQLSTGVSILLEPRLPTIQGGRFQEMNIWVVAHQAFFGDMKFTGCPFSIEQKLLAFYNNFTPVITPLDNMEPTLVMDDLALFCCQYPDCLDYGKCGHGNLTVCGHYGTQ